MTASYQSWEMASGPTVAYKMASRTNGCVVGECPKGSNFSNFKVQDTLSRGFGETPKSSNYRMSSSQDNVVRGLSALSLRGHSQPEADFPVEENRSVSLGALCRVSSQSYRCTSPRSYDNSPFAFAQASGCWKILNPDTSACTGNFISSSDMDNQASPLHISNSDTGNLSHMDSEVLHQRAPLSAEYHGAMPTAFHCVDEVYQHESVGSFSNTLRSSSSTFHSTMLGTSKDDDVEHDTISESSLSSGNGMLLASSSSGEASHLSDDTEVQSAFKEPGDLSFSVGASSLPRKGLSRFYAGKARSFSCLTDVVSVKDLAKPEIPHAKKRRAISSSSGLPPLQKGASTISKKQLHNGKSTLALAVAMNRKEDYEAQASIGPSRHQKSLVPSRSYSLSDLHGATGSIFFIG